MSEELATFFQEEKKFNTTWEGDSVGMVRLLAMLDKLDLNQVRQTGERARSGLEVLAREYPEILKNVRAAGVMLGVRSCADWCDTLRDRAFRRCLVLLPAGDRALRFYPRYDTEPSAIDEALSILRLAIKDLVGGRLDSEVTTALEIRVGKLAIPLDTVEIVDLTPAGFETHKLQVLAVEQERYGATGHSTPDVLRAGRRPLLQFQLETLEATAANPPRDRDPLLLPSMPRKGFRNGIRQKRLGMSVGERRPRRSLQSNDCAIERERHASAYGFQWMKSWNSCLLRLVCTVSLRTLVNSS